MTTKTEQFKDNVYMFENYLNDFSLLNEHEPVNVKLWDELMIWAALLGITTVVYKERTISRIRTGISILFRSNKYGYSIR